MRDSQMQALLIIYMPLILLFQYGFNTITIGLNVIVFVILCIIAENEFIKDCRKGYVSPKDSIFPNGFYKFIDLGVENNE